MTMTLTNSFLFIYDDVTREVLSLGFCSRVSGRLH